MTSIEILQEMILPEATIQLQENYNKWEVILSEPNCPGCEVTISSLPQSSIVIKGDTFPPPSHIFQNTKEEMRKQFLRFY